MQCVFMACDDPCNNCMSLRAKACCLGFKSVLACFIQVQAQARGAALGMAYYKDRQARGMAYKDRQTCGAHVACSGARHVRAGGSCCVPHLSVVTQCVFVAHDARCLSLAALLPSRRLDVNSLRQRTISNHQVHSFVSYPVARPFLGTMPPQPGRPPIRVPPILCRTSPQKTSSNTTAVSHHDLHTHY